MSEQVLKLIFSNPHKTFRGSTLATHEELQRADDTLLEMQRALLRNVLDSINSQGFVPLRRYTITDILRQRLVEGECINCQLECPTCKTMFYIDEHPEHELSPAPPHEHWYLYATARRREYA